MIQGRYANIIIDISHEKVDRPFQYLIPEELRDSIKIGDCVTVPFGRGNALKNGYVVGFSDETELDPSRIKSVKGRSTEYYPVDGDLIRLAAWIKDTYGSTMISALKTVLPAKKVVKRRQNRSIIRRMGKEEIISLYAQCIKKKQLAKARILKELSSEELLPYDLVISKLNVSAPTIQSLVKDGAIAIEVSEDYSIPVKPSQDDGLLTLSDEQSYICEEIGAELSAGIDSSPSGGKYLIHGITGSGKTEVYLRLIEQTIRSGRQCIMLIPEIALTYQTLMRFYKRFKNRVAVINSTLSLGEKYEQCERARKGDIDVIIGPRSALFVPFSRLGLVIIDEEHEGTYISEQTPRYHAVDTAIKLCELKQAALVLGSATPSVESYFRARKGIYRLFKLSRRLTGQELPQTRIIDLREELKSGNRSILSRELQESIEDRLNRHEQVMLFLNRRGYSGFISCRACGHVMKCPHCDVSLSRHKNGRLSCHYCGYEQKDVSVCPSCGSKYISGFKAGTEQIEEAVQKLFEGVRTLRMDADTTRTKDSYENILGAFASGEADVLIGTQMIVKGHDFPNVTLVGIICADLSLNEADFKTGERTFQLLTQAVGRAGRGLREGEAIIQTYRPEHYSIQLASIQDYEAFYEEEIVYRMVGDYPPTGAMLHVLVQSRDERRALGLATALRKRVPERIRVLGPAREAISRINDYYRYSLYLKSADSSELALARQLLEDYLDTAPLESELVSFDIQ